MATEQQCIEALQTAAQRLGESPTKAQYEQLNITPSASTVLRHCGGWNDAKEQAGLETNFSRGSRVAPKPDDVDLPEGLVWEELSQDQRWHYKNREQNGKRTLQRRQRLKAWVYTLKSERGCQQCGVDDGACLDFHHRPGADKDMKVSQMVNSGYSRAKIRAEIQKCAVLCANCHRREHIEAPTAMDRVRREASQSPADIDSLAEAWIPDRTQLQRAWVHLYKSSLGCSRCGEADGVCLDFHHRNEQTKRCSISELISFGCPGTTLRIELQKCEVLCANCHRKEHYDVPSETPTDEHASSGSADD